MFVEPLRVAVPELPTDEELLPLVAPIAPLHTLEPQLTESSEMSDFEEDDNDAFDDFDEDDFDDEFDDDFEEEVDDEYEIDEDDDFSEVEEPDGIEVPLEDIGEAFDAEEEVEFEPGATGGEEEEDEEEGFVDE